MKPDTAFPRSLSLMPLLSAALLIAMSACIAIGKSPLASSRATRVGAVDIDLAKRARTGGVRAIGSTVSSLEDGAFRGVRVTDARIGRGDVVAWLDDVKIGDGIIELDIRGKDEFQKSFPGVIFRAANDSVYDVVYLRPFNFRATDTLRHQHAVQYMSRPDYDFDRLRKERPEEFENPVSPEPDPNGWVHVRLVLAGKRVSVYVSEGAEPDLVVEALNDRGRGQIGLFNAGDYANLRVTAAPPR